MAAMCVAVARRRAPQRHNATTSLEKYRYCTTMSRLRPTVTIFSSIVDVAESLSSACTDIPLRVLADEALGGYGGTVEFDPKRLSTETVSALKEAEILIAEPAVIASLLMHDASSLQSLKWCQSTYAGVDPLFRTAIPAHALKFRLTRFAGCFGPPIAEWTLARIIEHERGFAATASDQSERSWAGSRGKVLNYRYLSSLTLSVLGCGDIGRCIAAAAKAFGMRTIGYTRTPRGEDSKNQGGVDEYTTDLSHALQSADYIVSALPSTPETRGLLSGDALAIASKEKGGKCPVFLNVGRGDVIDEVSVVRALDNQCISAAILDVFEVEPLPVESPLWSHTKVVVSPHVSGLTQASDVPKVFLCNYERYVDGKSLYYLVDWDKGY